MGLMEAMTGYRKKDPYQEALVQLDKTNPGFAKFLRHVAKKTGNTQLALEQFEGMLVEYRKVDAQRQNADRIGECRERRAEIEKQREEARAAVQKRMDEDMRRLDAIEAEFEAKGKVVDEELRLETGTARQLASRGPAAPQPLWIYQEEPKRNSRHANVLWRPNTIKISRIESPRLSHYAPWAARCPGRLTA